MLLKEYSSAVKLIQELDRKAPDAVFERCTGVYNRVVSVRFFQPNQMYPKLYCYRSTHHIATDSLVVIEAYGKKKIVRVEGCVLNENYTGIKDLSELKPIKGVIDSI